RFDMAKRQLPSANDLRQLLEYDAATGDLRWRKRPVSAFASCGRLSAQNKANAWNSRNAGRPAFTASDGKGYLQGQVLKYHTSAHRVIWAMHHDEWPECIDHINGDKIDNRLANLRSVTSQQNSRNMPMPRTN